MTEKRFVMYTHKDHDYILDTPNTSLDFIEMLGDALSSEEVVDLLNEQEEEIQRLKWSNKILRVNKKDCELGRREERKRWVKMDEMRIEHIRLLQKRLKKNGLSIYVNGDVDD